MPGAGPAWGWGRTLAFLCWTPCWTCNLPTLRAGRGFHTGPGARRRTVGFWCLQEGGQRARRDTVMVQGRESDRDR